MTCWMCCSEPGGDRGFRDRAAWSLHLCPHGQAGTWVREAVRQPALAVCSDKQGHPGWHGTHRRLRPRPPQASASLGCLDTCHQRLLQEPHSEATKGAEPPCWSAGLGCPAGTALGITSTLCESAGIEP